MSDVYNNIQSVIDLLESHDVAIVATDHEHDYRTGTARVEFDLTVSVPVHEQADYTQNNE